MDLEIVDYKRELDKELIDFFYESIFYKRKEFEYSRVPKTWIYRYDLNDDYITKIALLDGKIIGSLGILTRNCKANDKSVKVGCFVDNCVSPNYEDNYDEIFSKLFKEVEKEANKRNIKIVYGWEYLKNLEKHKNFFTDLGFKWVKGVNWYPGGSNTFGEYPYHWETNVSLYWNIGFSFLRLKHKIKEWGLNRLPKSIKIRELESRDISDVLELFDNYYKDIEFAPSYTKENFIEQLKRNNIYGFVAEKESKIIGVLTYITAAWSGWMFGKPYYDEKWQTSFTFTPDEFVVLPEYHDTLLPEHMVLKLLKLKNPEKDKYTKGYSFIVDIFDRRIRWRRKALLTVGCDEPKYDYGAIIVKILSNDIKLDTNKIWHLPARYIVAPVPSSSYFQK